MTEAQLAAWTGPSSTTEAEKQARTERMVREAIAAHSPFDGVTIRVYSKGSYPNNTNVKTESDVDIAVQCDDCTYWGEATQGAHPSNGSYTGIWNPSKLRAEVGAALEATFPGAVDSGGKMAFLVQSSSARVDADVVPCFNYRYYFTNTSYRNGSRIFRKDGTSVINYAAQQLEYGRAKNNQTGTNYKKVVRILKRTANAMQVSDTTLDLPSFFVESLVYNCPDAYFTRSSWTERTKAVLFHIYESLEGDEPSAGADRWLEANGCKYLFTTAQPWTRADGRDFANKAWGYLGFAL
jgi:hypothetical protein